MAFEIYARWKGQDAAAQQAQGQAVFQPDSGAAGYLREAPHGEPYATKILVPEAFAYYRVKVPASTLRERLPKALEAAAERQKIVYRINDPEYVEPIFQSYRDFVDLCERKEMEIGEPVMIYLDW